MIGCAALVAVVLGTSWLRDPELVPKPPTPAEQQTGDAVTDTVADPRTHPGFDEAYTTVCEQTVSGLEAVYAAAAVGAPDLLAVIDSQQRALVERIDGIYERDDLWNATDPLVLEYAETIAEDLASILDGTDVGFEFLDGDVALFRSLCEDWFAPL